MRKEEISLKIYREYESRLKNFIIQRTKPEDVEEIFQETIISATEDYSFFSGKSSFFTWLCGIANHEIADYYRKKKIKTFLFSHFPFLEDLVSEALGPEEEMLKEDLRKEVRRVLARLSEGYSEILRLKYYQGMKMREIARRLGVTVKAVESRLTRARGAFRERWAVENKK